MTILYVCYQSVREPLTHTQVIAYLKGLTGPTRQIVLFTFEPESMSPERQMEIRQELCRFGIEWRWLRYHKRPTLPATLFDIFAGIAYGARLVRKSNIQVIHARSHVPGVMALALKWLTGVRMVLDFRGLMAEEYVDAQVWRPNGFLFKLAKRTERRLMNAADSVIVLTERARRMLEEWYPSELASKPVRVIPCCVVAGGDTKQRPASTASPVTLAYCGKLGGLYAAPEMARFVRIASEIVNNLQFHVWTQSDARIARKAAHDEGIAGITTIGSLPPSDVVTHLAKTCDAALSFIRPCFSKQASSPTKVAEYLAGGLPVIVTGGIGDLDEIVLGEGVGIVLPEFSDDVYREAAQRLLCLLADRALRSRCVAVARKYFDLEQIGWARYRAIYDELTQV
jgi:glycosyltransferase involved in cell wall biosynthesis